MNRRLLTVQDISCVGQCSLTVALPIISALGIETAILPTAILSTHTGGFKGFTFRDLCDDIPKIAEHWKSENILFDAVYTGYLGSCEDVDYVIDIAENLTSDGAKIIVDPAMGDNGRLYTGFHDDYVEAMKRLCKKADILLPNITEASYLLGIPYPKNIDEDTVDMILNRLHEQFGADVVLTGVGYDSDKLGVAVLANGSKYYYSHRRIGNGSHGTGDVYASAFVGTIMNNIDIYTSAKIAADYVVRCIENTVDDKTHWYGVKFETAIGELIKAVNE